MIPQQDSAVRAFNKLARTFAAQVETLDTGAAVSIRCRAALRRRLAVAYGRRFKSARSCGAPHFDDHF